MGRELQKSEGQRPQTVLMMPLLEGLDGVQKMSKSLGNYIGITDTPTDMFGKIMSISDVLMWRYYELLSFKPLEVIAGYKVEISEGKNPRDVKIDLAKELIARFHDESVAQAAHDEFINRFQKGALPDDIPELTITTDNGEIAIANLLKEAGLVASTSDAFRMIKQGAAKIDSEKVTDRSLIISAGTTAVYQVGKRKFARITIS
ncbi:MAG: tyrosyl-tRNA synthetase [Colwellia sp.]|jgi:tyrosyl-tRNA synthetase